MSKPCEWVRARLACLRDQELPPEEQRAVEEHCRTCAACGERLAALERQDDALRAAMRSPERTPEDDALFDRRLAAFRERFDQEAADEARRREMEASGGRLETFTPDQAAQAPIEPSLVRGAGADMREERGPDRRPARPRGWSARLFAPRPFWHWASVAGAAAAVALITTVLIVRDPGSHRDAPYLLAPAEPQPAVPAARHEAPTATDLDRIVVKEGGPGMEEEVAQAPDKPLDEAAEPVPAVKDEIEAAPRADLEEAPEATVPEIEVPAPPEPHVTAQFDADEEGIVTHQRGGREGEVQWNVRLESDRSAPDGLTLLALSDREQAGDAEAIRDHLIAVAGAADIEIPEQADLLAAATAVQAQLEETEATREKQVVTQDAPRRRAQAAPDGRPAALWTAVGDAWYQLWLEEVFSRGGAEEADEIRAQDTVSTRVSSPAPAERAMRAYETALHLIEDGEAGAGRASAAGLRVRIDRLRRWLGRTPDTPPAAAPQR